MATIRRAEVEYEQAEEAFIEGDLPFVPGTARAALSHPAFRVVWSGLFASSIGTWMQNFTLAAFAWKLTHSTAYVGLLGFAQLGPLLFLSTFGGVLADVFDRTRLLVAMQLELLVAHYPTRAGPLPAETGLRRLASGFRMAWADRLVRRILVTMTTFSFFSLAFIYLMPALAADNLHIDPRSLAYGLLFAAFALG